MKNFISIALTATLSSMVPMILVSCNSQSFKGVSSKMRPPNELPATGATTGGFTAGTTTGPGGGGTTRSRNTEIINGQVCVNDIPAVDIALVVDRSITMSGQIRAVRDGLANFSSTIQRTNLPGFDKPISKLRFTLIAYEDVTNDNTWFNGGPWAAGDPQIGSALTTQFSKVNSRATDFPEGGIMAVREALQIFNAQQEESVKVVVLVTDNYMHDGTGSQDERYGGFSTLDSLFASPKMKPFMLFSSSSTSNDGDDDFEDGTENTFDNIGRGTAQIQAMRQHYKQIANLPNAYVGEEFVSVDDFNSSSLSGLVAGKIAAGIKKCP